MSSAITGIHAREVLDSRGKPTVEVEVAVASGHVGRALVPSGASTGAAEAVELRDGDPSWYDGLGVRRAVGHVNEIIAGELSGRDVLQQWALDEALLRLDGTARKSRLGANAVLGVSLAAAHAAALSQGMPLFGYLHQLYATVAATGGAAPAPPSPRMPLPMTNMISGGLHAGRNLDLQDVLVMPVGAPDYRTALEWIVRVHRRLGRILVERGLEGTLVADEGGYGPRLSSNQEALELVLGAIEAARLRPGLDMALALDVAATHFREGDAYRLITDGDVRLSGSQMVDRLQQWVASFPIVSIEDGLAEDDWPGWVELTRRLGDKVQLIGDDLFVTDAGRVRRGAAAGAANGVLIKPNQIGTLSETLQTIHVARQASMSIVVSARSGETEDTTISDLAVGVAADQIKIGSIVRGERLAKYNQLLRIEEQLVQLGFPATYQ